MSCYVILCIAEDGTHSIVGDEHGKPFLNRWTAEASLALHLPDESDTTVMQIERL